MSFRTNSPIVTVPAFILAAILVAWFGAYVATFVLPMDEVSSRALGAPQFAYSTILAVRLAVTGLGCLMFAVTRLLTRARPAVSRPGPLRAMVDGVAYSASVFALSNLTTIYSGAVPILWLAIVGLPVVLGRVRAT
jgi:hypothetical protein